MKRYAEDSNYWKTTVKPSKSQREIRQLLENFGVTNYAIRQGRVRGKPAWVVRFEWQGVSHRYVFLPLECKEPDKIGFFGWKRHSHAEQACFQMGQEALEYLNDELAAVKRRDNLEIITHSLERIQSEGGVGCVDFYVTTPALHHIYFTSTAENSRLYSSTLTLDIKQAARLKFLGWQSLLCDQGFGFYQQWRAKTDADRVLIAQEVIRTFVEVYGLAPHQLLGGVNIVIDDVTVESMETKYNSADLVHRKKRKVEFVIKGQ